MSKSIVKPKTLAGFQDLLPAEALAQQELLDQIKEIFHSFGFGPIQTPHLELSEMLLSESDGEIGKQLFRFKDNGDRDVCLRYDLTVPLARFVVEHLNDLGLPFKRYAIGSCFRGERPQHGRLREFTQCDFDILGVDSVYADLEILQIIAAGFQKLGLNFKIKINSRGLLNCLAESFGVSNVTEFIRLLDKRDKIPADSFNQVLSDLGMHQNTVTAFNDLLSKLDNKSEGKNSGIGLELLTLMEEYIRSINTSDLVRERFDKERDYFQNLANKIEHNSCLYQNLSFDFTLARGFGYYTGCIFETILTDAPEVGSVAGGGRYNNLTQNFSRDSIPGVGASFGISRILIALEKLGSKDKKSTADVLFANLDESLGGDVVKMASSLRSQGLRVELYPEVAKLKKQLQFADRKQIPYLLIYNTEEHEKGKIILKDLSAARQESFDRSDLNTVIDAIRKG